MTAKGVVDALNKEGFQALVRLVNLIGTPAIATIGVMFLNQANIIIDNQEKWSSIMMEHERKLHNDSTSIGKILKADRLFVVKQDACLDALKVNSEIGIEFLVDYDKRYGELLRESQFLNP